jgi:hypothetical protein
MQLLVSLMLSRPFSSFEGREVSLNLLSNSSTLLVKLDQRWVAADQQEFRARETGSMLNEEQV